jgi:hypothetical protein
MTVLSDPRPTPLCPARTCSTWTERTAGYLRDAKKVIAVSGNRIRGSCVSPSGLPKFTQILVSVVSTSTYVSACLTDAASRTGSKGSNRPAAYRAAPIRRAHDGVAPATGRRSGLQRAGHRSMATGGAQPMAERGEWADESDLTPHTRQRRNDQPSSGTAERGPQRPYHQPVCVR